jgi:hypothetical protein
MVNAGHESVKSRNDSSFTSHVFGSPTYSHVIASPGATSRLPVLSPPVNHQVS